MMTKQELAEVIGMALAIRDQERATTDKAQGVGKIIKKVEANNAKVVKAKPKKAKQHPHAHNGVKLTAWQWAVWVAVKALFDAKKELTKDAEGFYSLSGKFVAQFMGTPFWTKKEVDRVNAAMAGLRKKGLLTWANEKIGKSKRKIKGGIGFGPKA